MAGALLTRPTEAYAVVKVNKSLGQESFRRIRDARKQLDSVDVPLRSRKFEEVQVSLDHGLLNAMASPDRTSARVVSVLPSRGKQTVYCRVFTD